MGGTFNPPHKGHLEAARQVYHALTLDQVLFIPTNIPPHKSIPQGSATAQQRCDMLTCMLKQEPWAKLNSMEIIRGGPSYTIDTVRALHAQYALEALVLIVGTDMLLELETWRNLQDICQLACFAVVARATGDAAILCEKKERLTQLYGANIDIIHCPAIPISSSALRAAPTMHEFLSPSVAAYIQQNCLYQ